MADETHINVQLETTPERVGCINPLVGSADVQLADILVCKKIRLLSRKVTNRRTYV